MNILAIDTATEACSAALYLRGELFSKYQLAPREHSRLILKMIDDLLHEADLSISSIDAIAFGRGPGSFMGLRIAAGVVQGIAFAHDIPVIPVSTLKAIAQRAYQQTQSQHVLAAIDARMDEVYWAAYCLNGQHWQLQVEEQVVSPESVSLPENLSQPGISWIAAGSGWSSYKDRLLHTLDCPIPTVLADCYPSAEVIAGLAAIELAAGNTISAAEAIPVYLRNNVAKKPKPVVL